jgi:hypothetical protein
VNDRLDELLADAGTQRCLAALTGQKPATLSDFEACYGDERENDEPRFSSAAIALAIGVPFRCDDGSVILPRWLVEKIDRVYEGVSRAGFLTERDFEERLYGWLTER